MVALKDTITFDVDIYQDALEAYNAEHDATALPLDSDEWDEYEWMRAFAEEIAVITSVGE